MSTATIYKLTRSCAHPSSLLSCNADWIDQAILNIQRWKRYQQLTKLLRINVSHADNPTANAINLYTSSLGRQESCHEIRASNFRIYSYANKIGSEHVLAVFVEDCTFPYKLLAIRPVKQQITLGQTKPSHIIS